MKLYIAASSKELDRAERWISRASDAGFVISYDWTVPVRERGSGTDLSFEEKRSFAMLDRNAIFEARAFWFLVPQEITFGGTWEFGFALGLATDMKSRIVILSGPTSRDHIFTTLADECYLSDELAFEALLRTR